MRYCFLCVLCSLFVLPSEVNAALKNTIDLVDALLLEGCHREAYGLYEEILRNPLPMPIKAQLQQRCVLASVLSDPLVDPACLFWPCLEASKRFLAQREYATAYKHFQRTACSLAFASTKRPHTALLMAYMALYLEQPQEAERWISFPAFPMHQRPWKAWAHLIQTIVWAQQGDIEKALTHLLASFQDRSALLPQEDVLRWILRNDSDHLSHDQWVVWKKKLLAEAHDLDTQHEQLNASVQPLHALESSYSFSLTHTSSEQLLQQGILYFRLGRKQEAKAHLEQMLTQPLPLRLRVATIFWLAMCSSQDERTETLSSLFKEYPHSPYAPWALLFLETPRDYMTGGKPVAKRLHQILRSYPASCAGMVAHYFLAKRQMHSTANLRELKEALYHYNKILEQYEDFTQTHQDAPRKNQFASLHREALTQSALLNLAIAKKCKGSARAVSWKYAKSSLLALNTLFDPSATRMAPREQLPVWLALSEIFLEEKNIAESHALLEQCSDVVDVMQETEDADLRQCVIQLWTLKGALAQLEGDHSLAIHYLQQAERELRSVSPNTFPNQIVSLWFAQASSYAEMGDVEQALLSLSKITHQNVPSSVKREAMLRRIALYEQEGRTSLAQKQREALEALSHE